MKLDWIRPNKRFVSADGSGYRWTASFEDDGVRMLAEIVTGPFGSPRRYRLTLSIEGVELSRSEHEKLRLAQEQAAALFNEAA